MQTFACFYDTYSAVFLLSFCSLFVAFSYFLVPSALSCQSGELYFLVTGQVCQKQILIWTGLYFAFIFNADFVAHEYFVDFFFVCFKCNILLPPGLSQF